MSNLPENWVCKTIGEIALVNPRKPKSISSLDPDTPVSFVPMAAVSDIDGRIVEPQTKALREVSRGFTYFADGDVLFAKITPSMQNGKAAIAASLSSGLGFGSTEFHVLRPSEGVLAEWIYHFVRQQSFRDEATRHFRGSAGQQRVPGGFLAEHSIPVPTVVEQRRIVLRLAECLARIDELERTELEARSYPHLIRNAYVLELLGLDKCTDWNDVQVIEGDFQWRALEDIATFIARGRHSKQGTSETYLAKTRHVWPGGLKDFSDVRLDATEAPKVRHELLLQQHDVLLACSARGSLGRCSIVSSPIDYRATVDTHVAIIRADSARIHPRYLFEVLTSPLGKYLLVSSEAGGRWHEEKIGFRYAELNLQDLKQIRIPIPSLVEQRDILRLLEQFDATANPLEDDLASVVDYAIAARNAVYRQAFAGEL